VKAGIAMVRPEEGDGEKRTDIVAKFKKKNEGWGTLQVQKKKNKNFSKTAFLLLTGE